MTGGIRGFIEDLRQAMRNASRYLSNVFLAVLLMPVIPDMLLDLFGRDQPKWRNPLLRLLSVGIVLAVVLAFDAFRRWRAQRRNAQRLRLRALPRFDVVVLPLGPNDTYTADAAMRGNDIKVPELVVDQAMPSLVICVATDQVRALDQIRAGMESIDIDTEQVILSNPYDPAVTVRETADQILPILKNRSINPATVCFDTTGGTVMMSFAMLRLAARHGSRCCYVSSDLDDTGRRAPNTQNPVVFTPTDLVWSGDPDA